MTKIAKIRSTYVLNGYCVTEIEDGRTVKFSGLPSRKLREEDFTPYENTNNEELTLMKIHESVFYLDDENYDLW